jgi:L-threonylcarbamoyladenylate synthase
MRVLSKEEFEQEKDIIRTQLREKDIIFIYPTDTIYGIGCNAQNKKAVEEIRKIKQRKESPFSIIAPSKGWILENCEVNEKAKEWLAKLPGPYTLIFKTKKSIVDENVAPKLDTLGIRIPDNWFSKFVEETGTPIVTTSVNKTGSDFMTSMDDLDNEIKSKVDFIVYEGIKTGKPSKIINLANNVEIIER